MFSSGGYFRGFNCPFFASGLCERPYCHYRHVRTEEDKPQSKAVSGYSDAQYEVNWTPGNGPSSSAGEQVKVNKYTGEPEVLNDSEKITEETPPAEQDNVNKYTGEPIVTQQSNEYIVEVKNDCQKYKPTDKKSLKFKGEKLKIQKPVQKVNKYTGEPVSESEEKQAYTPEARNFPEYNPTPINQLKPSPPKYKADTSENENEQEYDPQSNFSTTLKPSQPMAIKRSFTYDPTTPDFHHPAKKAKEEPEVQCPDDDNQSDEGEMGMFSDEEEEMISESREDDVDTMDNEENSTKPSMITDVKVFESLLMPVMDHDNESNDKLSDSEKNSVKSKKSQPDTKHHAKKSSSSEKSSNHIKNAKHSSQKSQHSSRDHISKENFSKKSSKSSTSSNSKKHSSSRASSSKSSSENGPIKSSEKQSSSHSSSSNKSHKHSHQKSSSSSSKGKSSSEKESSKKASSSHHSHEQSKLSSSDKSSGKVEKSRSQHEKSSSKHEKSSNKHEQKKHSSDKKTKNDRNNHDTSSKSSKGSRRNSTENERKQRDRSVSIDSNGSKRKIVDINVDLFGADSDDEGDVPFMSDEEEDPYEECLRIYNENNVSRPSPKKQSHSESKMNDTDQSECTSVQGKKRTAHKGSTEVKRKIPQKPHSKLTPAQIMHNRFVQMQKQAQEEAERSQEPSTSSSNGKQRVAHQSKHGGQGTKVVDGKTVIATASKSQKRTAHTPNVKNLKRPTIPAEYGSKVPISVRQRYLNTIIDECLPLYVNEEDAFKRGLEEELAVYKRASNKNVYLNVACNTIKRLRNETNESCKSPTKPTSPQKMSHEAVLGGKNATKTTFTLNRSGGSYRGPMENFKGTELYNRLSKYVLAEEQLQENGFPRPDPENSSAAKVYTVSQQEQNSTKLKTYEKICVRCGKRFMVYPNGTYAQKEECVYHWGKAWKKKIAGYIETRYTCCQGDLGAEGCQVAKYHVHETNKWENRIGYMQTLPCSPVPDGDYGVYAMDCEMVYTQGGVELARVTVTDSENNSVYETLVRPDRKIIDHNTRFSGITAEDMEGVTTTLRDVQAVLLSLFTEKTILIGHSLESDLSAVKIIHNTVVDTSVVFPHRLGPPYKRALKTLMAEYLKKIIQDDVGGHDSQEDAISCMELMHWRIKEDARKEPRSS